MEHCRTPYIVAPLNIKGRNDSIEIEEVISKLTFISCLPVEILSIIFLIVQEYSDYYWRRDKTDRPWFFVTHVCRSWRNIALGHKVLWTKINTEVHANINQTKSYIERSGNAELVVRHCYDTFAKDAVERLQEVFQHFNRIRELYIWGIDGIPIQIITSLQRPAPKIQVFCIRVFSEETIDVGSFFSGQAPKLRDFSFDAKSTSWKNMPYLQGLKKLFISSTTTELTLEEVLCIVAANPGLESFEVHYLKEEEKATLDQMTMVELPHLKVLGICETTYDAVERLLRSLRLPTSAELEFEIACHDFPIGNLYTSSILSITANREDHCRAIHLLIEPINLLVQGDSYAERDGQPIHHSFDYRFSEYPIPVAPSVILKAVCGIVGNEFWSTATELNVTIDGENFPDLSKCLEASSWIELLRLLPRLQKISVRSAALYVDPDNVLRERHSGLLEALLHIVDDDDDNVDRPLHIITPYLSELCLDGFPFVHGFPALLRALSFRAKHARPGSRLHLFEVNNPFEVNRLALDILKDGNMVDHVELYDEI